MSQVLARATLLMDLLRQESDRPLGLGLLAERSGLAPATCARLLRSLVQLGWVDQLGSRGAYRLGPRLYALTHELPYKQRLIAAARPLLHALVQRIGETCELAMLRGTRRQRLYVHEAEQVLQVRLDLVERDDIYRSAGGRVLLARLSVRERERLITRLGAPNAEQWPEIADLDELRDELRAIRRQGYALVRFRDAPVCAMATAIPDGEGGHAALGSFMPSQRYRPEHLDALLAAGTRIRDALVGE